MKRWAWPAPKRLSWRIVAGSLALLLLVQLAVFATLHARIDKNAEARLGAELQVAEGIWRSELQSRAATIRLGTALLARDAGFVAAVGQRDRPTIASALDNQRDRIDATVAAAFGQDLQDLASAPAEAAPALPAMRRVAARFVRTRQAVAVELVGSTPFQFVAAPLPLAAGGGVVVMGFSIDAALLRSVKDKSRMDVAIVTRRAGAAPLVDVSTLDAAQRRDLAALPARDGRYTLGGESMLVHGVALADGLPARALLLGSVDAAMRPYQVVQRDLGVITAVAMGLFFVGSLVTARRITTPLEALVGASRRLGRGEYDQAMQHTERGDEIGELARSFDRMRLSIAANQQQIRRLAYWDRLTGLPNRAQFRDAVQAAIDGAAQADGRLAVVMLDLDRFKHVNDVLGYPFGDRLLQSVAERIKGQLVREGDLVARLSGDEFALLLPRADSARALAVAERIAQVFEQPLVMEDQTVDVSASFGIACWPGHAADADALLSRAEVAMYGAKRKTASALVYDPSIDAGSAQTLSLLSELRRAIEHDELRLFLQPKIAVGSGALVGAEALVRWQHPTRGMVPPMEFIPFAEQTGFVRQLTLWIFEATAREWAALAALGLQRVSVNLSARDLLDHELPAKLDTILVRHRVGAAAFCLEITESAIMDEPQRAEATLNALKRAGFKLSIDDFGTGYSSLAYLKRLPVDELKIDKSFVMAMERDADDAKIVRSTIDLAHNLGLSVVAEGVENAAVLRQLQALDCDEAQGYHMSRPLPAATMAAFAQRWHERRNAAASAALH